MSQATAHPALKAMHRAMWGAGDYHRFATATVWSLGPRLVEACGIAAGLRVLDVAAGTGNVAIRAAAAGASVVASDLTPEHFEAGRGAAREAGVTLEWREADAEALPFADGAFDVVTSSFGAMFAPDHAAAAREMLRVCRPGGTIGLISFRPEGAAAAFFGLFARHTPPADGGAPSPLAWGDDEYVRGLFGDRVANVTCTRAEYVEHAVTFDAYLDLFRHCFGPLVSLYAALAGDPARTAALDDDLRAFVSHWGRQGSDGRFEVSYPYLLVVARRAQHA